MLDGKKYFESFPDEAGVNFELGKDPVCRISLTAELKSALEELKKYFQQFLNGVAQ